MSLNAFPLQPSLVLPATLDLSKRPYQVSGGYRNHTLRRFQPSGSATDYTGGLNFSISIPDGVGLSRRAYLEVIWEIPVNLTAEGTPTYYQALDASGFALRSYPLNRSIASEQITINNNTYTQNPRDWIDLVVHSCDDDVHKVNCLNSVFRRDNVVDYVNVEGGINDPLASYKDGTYASPSRGSGYYDLVAIVKSNGSVATITEKMDEDSSEEVVLRIRTTEAVLCPPFYYEKSAQQPALFGADTLEMQVNWVSLANSISLACCNSNQVRPNGNAIPTSPFLYLEYFSPKIGFVVPREISYDVFELVAYTQSQQVNVADGASTTISNNNIKLSNSTPTRLFVFIRFDPNTLGLSGGQLGTSTQFQTANHFFPITGINITFNNQTGLLSSATQQQLWDLSRQNGLEQEFEEFSGRVYTENDGKVVRLLGSVLSIDPSRDLSLESDNANGVQGDNQLSMEVSFTNHLGSALSTNLQLVVVALYESLLNVKDRSMFTQSKGVISPADVLNSQTLPVVYEQQIAEMYGGKRTMGTKIGRFFKKVGDVAKKVAESDIGKKLLKKGAEKASEMLGLGMTGAGMTGGRSMGRQQLLKMLQKEGM